MKKMISNKFIKKSKDLDIVLDIYKDSDFKKYYDLISQTPSKDISIYRKILDKDDIILEIGTGNGRIFSPLLELNYDIYGIEPSKLMIEKIKTGKNRIFQLTLQNIEKLSLPRVDVVIIPATTICLFSFFEFKDFIFKVKDKYPGISYVYFDFVLPDTFYRKNNIIEKVVIDDETYIYTNFIEDSKVYFNIINKNKLGISEKNLYTFELLKEYFGKNIKIINEYEGCCMCAVEMDGINNE
ncbi:methyltransferase domain-containing protein [Aerococcus urinaeequi]|uniref:methyltransferase domain-containing protein n=1 Tax=Aerococcus urinaeequi TaxID=51665 RepID=UPI003D6ADB07